MKQFYERIKKERCTKDLQTLFETIDTQVEALNDNLIGTQHIVSAFLNINQNTIVGELLQKYNITYNKFVESYYSIVKTDRGDQISKDVDYSDIVTPMLIDILRDLSEDNQEISSIDLFVEILQRDGLGKQILIQDLTDKKLELLIKKISNLNYIEKKEIIEFTGHSIYNIDILSDDLGFRNLFKTMVFKVDAKFFKEIEENNMLVKEKLIDFLENSNSQISVDYNKFPVFILTTGKGNKVLAIVLDTDKTIKSKILLSKESIEEVNEISEDLKISKKETLIEKVIEDEKLKILVSQATSKENIESMNKYKKELDMLLNSSILKETSKAISRHKDLVNFNKKVSDEKTTIVGFEEELEQLMKTLLRVKKPNVIITGEPGVGKTALVEKFACEINNGNVPEIFKNNVVVSLNISGAVAGTKYRGEFEEKFNEIVKLLEENKNIILFIDEFHNVINAGGSEGAIGASEILKPALARGQIRVIGATTNKEYSKFIKNDGAFSRRFARIDILEPTKDQVIEIMNSSKIKLEELYSIKVSKNKVEELYDKSKYKDLRMPDAALDELEEYCINLYFENEKINLKKGAKA